jgi:hypothetical protein
MEGEVLILYQAGDQSLAVPILTTTEEHQQLVRLMARLAHWRLAFQPPAAISLWFADAFQLAIRFGIRVAFDVTALVYLDIANFNEFDLERVQATLCRYRRAAVWPSQPPSPQERNRPADA